MRHSILPSVICRESQFITPSDDAVVEVNVPDGRSPGEGFAEIPEHLVQHRKPTPLSVSSSIAEDCSRSRLAMLLLQLPQMSEVQSASAPPKALCVPVSNDPFQTLLVQTTL